MLTPYCRHTLGVLLSCTLFTAGNVLFCSIASAQPPKPATPPDAGVHFQKAINAFAKQNRWAIVAEGAPLALDETFADSEKYKRASEEGKFLQLADAADYEAKHSAANPRVWILTKRYTDPRDMACVTLAECAQSFQKIAAFANPLLPPRQANVPDPTVPIIQNIYRSLTPQQRQTMQGSPPEERNYKRTPPLPLTDLPREQKEAAQSIGGFLYLEDFGLQVKRLSQVFRDAPQAQLQKSEPSNTNSPEKYASTALLLSHFPNDPKTGYLLGGIGRMDTPEPGTTLPPAAPTTLEKEVTKVNARNKVATPSTLPCDVDPALTDKLLTVAGMENVDSLSALKAFADVYDLRLRTLNASRLLGFKPAWKEPVTLYNVRDAFLYTLPFPYARLFAGEVSEKTLPSGDVLREFSRGAQKSTIMYQIDRAAVKQMRVAYDARLAKEKKIPVSEMTPSEQPVLVAAIMAGFLPSAASIANRSTPNLITHRDDLYINIKQMLDEKNVPKLEMVLLYKDENGNLKGGGGVSNVPLPTAVP